MRQVRKAAKRSTTAPIRPSGNAAGTAALIFFLALQKHFVKGLTGGATKG